MKITIEQVEKLQERANVSYEEAKDALEKCDGDILEALINLEKDGKTERPGGGAYSTGGQANAGYNDQSQNQDQYNQNQNNANQGGPQMNYNQGQYQESDFSKQAKSVWRSILDLIHKGNINHFIISKNGQEIVRMPVNILIILLIIFNGAALIALIVCLFFGFRYSFEGPSMGRQNINNVMDSASDAAEDIKENVRKATADDNNQGNNQ